LPDLIIKIWLA